MLLNTPVSSLRLAQQCADIIAKLDMSQPQEAITAYIETDTGEIVQSLFVPPGNFPRWYMCRGNGFTMFFFHCTETIQQTTRQWAAYAGVATQGLVDPVSDFMTSWISEIRQRWTDNRITPGGTCIFSGHSAGGAVCVPLAKSLRDANTISPDYGIITFGAPCPGGRTVAQFPRPGAIRRYFAAEDPVPPQPSHLLGFVQPGLLWQAASLARINNFMQPAGGVEVAIDGSLTPKNEPASTVIPLVLSGAGLIWDFVSRKDSAHSIAEMQRRLAIDLGGGGPLGPEPDVEVVGGGGEWPPDVAANAMIQEFRQMERNVFQADVGRGVETVVLPSQQQFQIGRNGRIWYCNFRGVPVAMGPTKKKARALVRLGNQFLTRLQAEGVVDPDALTAQFIEYLEAAQDPTQGFRPQMRTTLP